MALKNILLFVIVCAFSGVCIFLGSVLGHGVGQRALFVGAIVGGVVGVAIAVWIARRFGLLAGASFSMTFVCGVVGFVIAAVIAVKNLHGPLIPMACVGLIGLGAVLGKTFSQRSAAD
jgi:hypothetical protein